VTTVLIVLLSLIVGGFTGYFLRDLVDAARLRRSREGRAMRRPTAQTVQFIALGAAVLLLLVEGLLLIKTRQETAACTKCTAQWQQQFSASYVARTEAAGEVSTAMDAVIKAVYTRDSGDFKKAISDYVQIRRDQDEARAKNPLPDPPGEVCGTPGGS